MAGFDGDGDEDLLLAAEWQPIAIFVNDKGVLAPFHWKPSGLKIPRMVEHFGDGDMDGDGDLICSPGIWIEFQIKGFITKSLSDVCERFVKWESRAIVFLLSGEWNIPSVRMNEMMKQMPSLKKRYLSYENMRRPHCMTFLIRKLWRLH